MPYRIVFTDIDGTLLNADRELSKFTIQEIRRIKSEIPVVLISSRMPSAMYHLQEQLAIIDQPLICYNGGLIVHNNNIISSTTIPIEHVQQIVEQSIDLQVHLSLYHKDEWYVPSNDFWAKREANNTKVTPVVQDLKYTVNKWNTENKGAHKIMCMGQEESVTKMYNYLKDNFEGDLHLYRSKPTYIEIASKTISKQTAVQHLLSTHYNIDIKNAVAFGDNYNDIAMIKAVGIGVAVANAKEETLKAAKHVTLHAKQDGVAQFIKDHIIL
ncbi:HAD family hydrolase [Aquimarina sp. W85]|uniref:HAD family hydrolase n=1 Tax=Aquimarina rhodophyticola TaxID=3342246 RepID=UPI00366FFC89